MSPIIAILGDIHFRDDKDYFCRICEDFLQWFKDWSVNTPDNSLILAGDLVERNLLTGKVAEYLDRFHQYSRFKKMYICAGNHDRKTVYNLEQLSYEFYKNYDDVEIFEEIGEADINGQKVLFLPYFTGQNSFGLTMSEYYSELYRDPKYQKHYDLIVGHCSGPELGFQGQTDIVRNLDKLDVDRICFGHIHTRFANPSVYIGSVFAGKKGENDNSRAAWLFDGTWKEQKLPLFNEFMEITYPQRLMPTQVRTPIYTVLNCANEAIAREKYGNIYIRKTSAGASDSVHKSLAEFDEQFLSVRNMKQDELFQAFITANPDLPKEVVEECRSALGIA